MNKEELINSIKKDNIELDEREQDIKRKSFIKGYEGISITLLLLILIRSFTDDKFYYDLGMIITGQAVFMSFYLYIEGRNKKANLTYTIIMGLLFLFMTYLTLGYYEFI